MHQQIKSHLQIT